MYLEELLRTTGHNIEKYKIAISENPESVETVMPYDRKRRRPLHTAIFWGNLELVKLLLESGADPNSEDWLGSTPTKYAASYHTNFEIIKLCLDYGGDPYKKNTKGASAMTWAEVTEDEKLKEFLVDNIRFKS